MISVHDKPVDLVGGLCPFQESLVKPSPFVCRSLCTLCTLLFRQDMLTFQLGDVLVRPEPVDGHVLEVPQFPTIVLKGGHLVWTVG